MIEACLFDFDGTLAELTLDFFDLRREVEEIALRHVSASFIRELDSVYMLEMIYAIERHLGQSGARFRKEALSRLRELEIEGANGQTVYPYTREVLRSLRDKGMRIGVMTRNCRAAIEKAFPDMDVYVNAVATREDVSAVKPHPAHVMALLGLLGHIDPGKALLVGDHPTDVLAGKASGVASVGVLTGRTARSAFTQAGATFVVNDIRDVPALIDEWQGQAMGKG